MFRNLVTRGTILGISSCPLSSYKWYNFALWRPLHLRVGDSAELLRIFTQKDVALSLNLLGIRTHCTWIRSLPRRQDLGNLLFMVFYSMA
ncbi:unnamed protein product [Staurois parvus]|uniref:Uncharacterized protein n=1 Tax=Staurois parvus TaxID=386267 RepID=A0ABN9HB90_9NEOB|nr:unnamed protein product [Staurois parvus]